MPRGLTRKYAYAELMGPSGPVPSERLIPGLVQPGPRCLNASTFLRRFSFLAGPDMRYVERSYKGAAVVEVSEAQRVFWVN
jgi:hypothetical protein